MSLWYYFGCGREAGHYLFQQNGSKSYRPPLERMAGSFDANLPPQWPGVKLYEASFSRLGGYGYSTIAWWDNTVDKRSGSNSVIFAPSLDIEPAAMLEEAKVRFPWVFSRLPTDLRLVSRSALSAGREAE